MAERTKGPFSWVVSSARHELGTIMGADGREVCDFGLAGEYAASEGHEPSPEDRAFMLAAMNAADRLGLTAEQLDAGVLEKLVEAVGLYLGERKHCDCYSYSGQPHQCWSCEFRAALAAFPKKEGDGFEAGTLPDNIPAWNEPTQRQLYGKECE